MNNRERTLTAVKIRLMKVMLRKIFARKLRAVNAMLPEEDRASEETMDLTEKIIMDRKTRMRFEVI